MNPSLLLHVVERLENVLHKLPDAIQRPVLREITPLKELFLRQRPARLLICGLPDQPLDEIVATLFATSEDAGHSAIASHIHRWENWQIGDRGSVSLLDARGVDLVAAADTRDEVQNFAPDIILCVDDFLAGRVKRKRAADSLTSCLDLFGTAAPASPILAVNLNPPKSARTSPDSSETTARDNRIAAAFDFSKNPSAESKRFCSAVSRRVPNEARVEMIRISGDREAQNEIAQTLTKSASVICGAIGAQPIPLADLPILTTLQLLMVSGIMYVSGRERSLRAATEFVAALGVNVGAGMLLREGTRAVLKFIPGWGNVVCGMIAAGGTYAMGRAASVYFIDGVSLKDARRTYLASRKRKSKPPYLESGERSSRKTLHRVAQNHGE